MPDHSPPEEAVATTAATVLPDPLDYSILGDEEVPWRDLQPWLEQRGYILRPRYRVGWVPKWKGTKISRLDHEDAIELAVSNFALFCKGRDFTGSGQRPHLLDATRVLTEELVMLKRISERKEFWTSPRKLAIKRFWGASTHTILSSRDGGLMPGILSVHFGKVQSSSATTDDLGLFPC